MSEKVCVITGGTSGIGKATAEAMRRRGYTVYELSRRETGLAGFRHIPADVTKPEMVEAAVAEILRQETHIDVLINNAGFGVSGAVEFTEAAAAKKQFQTYYSASKAAINSYTMALANEVKPFGLEVCAVMPGDIRTGFTAAREKSQAGDEVYQGRISRSVAGMEHDEQTGMLPETAGDYIASVATRRDVKPLRSIGLKYKFFCVLAKLLPVRTLNWLVGLIYAK